MSYILSVYSLTAYKDELLPAINDADFTLKLPGDLYGLRNDLEIYLEINQGSWSFSGSFQKYRIEYVLQKKSAIGQSLKDGDMYTVFLPEGGQVFIIVRVTQKGFSVFSKFALNGVDVIRIGSAPDNDLQYDFNKLISHHHAMISRSREGYILTDLQSANGTFVNSQRVTEGSYRLFFGDRINVYGLKLIFLGNMIAVDENTEGLKIRDQVFRRYVQEKADPGMTVQILPGRYDEPYHRSPRNIPRIESDAIEIEAPPQAKENMALPTLMAIGPSMTMALPMLLGSSMTIAAAQSSGGRFSPMMFTGVITAIGSASIGTFWAIKNMSHQKKKNREEELKRFEMYSEYLIRCANEIKEKYEQNTRALNELYHSAEDCVRLDRNANMLWNRNVRHEDFLRHRVGMGDIPFQVEIKIPKERFSLVEDSLIEKPRMMKESYKMLTNVPVCVDLFANKLIGVIGGDKYSGCYPVIRDLVVQIATENCYTDVKLAFVYDAQSSRAEEHWGFARWLPHVWSEDGKLRFVATDSSEAGDVFCELAGIFRFRAEEESANRAKAGIPKPYYILVVEDPEILEGELIAKYVYDAEKNYGLTTIMLAQSYDDLPNGCEFIIENTGAFQGSYRVTDGMDERLPIRFDMISGNALDRFARRFCGMKVREEETGGELPVSLSFFDMYGVTHPYELNVTERWRKNRTYESMKALVGQKAGGVPCYLDVHEKYHGPHGLVAGTTGSGKSETLQTYMLSLAVNYSPDDIGFFIIDYKGGGMANLFNGLPHVIGQISNLSGNQVHRAMVSIKSENRRRQRIFNEHGVNNINLYTRLYKNNEATVPVPHMFIIIDEFAELKREEPDFMRELISVAQVGRSLGVHLILATQKPAGTVDDNIWSNSKFRLCLRVQDRQDSMDMLHKADAAYITQAGRCYMQVGNDELYELFQSGFSGAVYDENGGSQGEIARMLTGNGRAALIGGYAQLKYKEKVRNRWIEDLLDIIDKSAEELGVDIASLEEDRDSRELLIERFFVIAEKKGLEYPDSDYNRHRIDDLILLYLKCPDGHPGQIVSLAARERKKLPERKEKTQLDAMVEYLAKVAAQNGYTHDLQLWLPVLPEELYLSELNGFTARAFDGKSWPEAGKKFNLETMIGLYDDPENQAQEPMCLDIAEGGNMAVVGTAMSGRSTFLTTYLYSLAMRYSPETVNFYILDYSSKMLTALSQLPHTGDVMVEEDTEKVAKFFTFLSGMIAERKRLLRGGNYSQYVRANGARIPAVIIAIDNYANFRAKTENRYDDRISAMLKETASCGIFFAVSAAGFSMSEIPGRIMDQFRQILTLQMADRFGYTEALRTIRLEVLPEENVKGRGLAHVGDVILEYQTALPLKAEDDFARGEKLREECLRMREAWGGKCARKVPTIPENAMWSDYEGLDEVIRMAQEGERLPAGYDRNTAMPYGIPLRSCYSYLVSGRSRSGKTNFLRILIASAHLMRLKTTVIDLNGELKRVSEECGAQYISDVPELFRFFDKELTPEFVERNKEKRRLAESGATEDEIYGSMQRFEKHIIVIGDLPEFLKKTDNPGEGFTTMTRFLCNLFEKGALHNIYWFAGFDQDRSAEISGIASYAAFVKDKNGIHLGGNTQAQRLMQFDHLPYAQQGKKLKAGIGLLPTHEEDSTVSVAIPLYRMG
ncbi:MAG: FHA domain-containing protein [Lachnospiraceae bacterium]|nr:FHA domain-containing protein [Lachnospiraceae bacterium]